MVWWSSINLSLLMLEMGGINCKGPLHFPHYNIHISTQRPMTLHDLSMQHKSNWTQTRLYHMVFLPFWFLSMTSNSSQKKQVKCGSRDWRHNLFLLQIPLFCPLQLRYSLLEWMYPYRKKWTSKCTLTWIHNLTCGNIQSDLYTMRDSQDILSNVYMQ